MNDQCRLLSLPLELREKIYSDIFANIYARRSKHLPRHELAILQTCIKIHDEASSVLYNRTPLRFIIGYRQVASSILPLSPVLDRFQNIFFELVQMSSTYPSYEFDNPWKELTAPFIQSHIRRKTCYIQCDLEEFAGRSRAPSLFARIKSFVGFETFSIIFEGNVLKSEFPNEPIVGDDPQTQDRLMAQMSRRGNRQSEYERLTDVERMFCSLEKHLGEGRMIDFSKDSKALYASKLVFHPLQRAVES